MKIVPVKKEDLLNELGQRSRLVKLTVEDKKTVTKEVSNISVEEIIESMTDSPNNEFFFKIMEDRDNE